MLNELAQRIFEANKAKGFHDEKKQTGVYLMLMVSELAEALEADRKFRYANLTGLESDMKYMGEPDTNYYENSFQISFNIAVKGTFEDELADCLIRILDYCGLEKIDIQKHVEYKLQYNSLRPHKHGKAY